MAENVTSEERDFNQRTIDDKIYVVGSSAGRERDPAWAFNIRAHPAASIEIGSDPPRSVTARELPRYERDSIYAVVADRAPGFSEYETRTDRLIPVFELVSTN